MITMSGGGIRKCLWQLRHCSESIDDSCSSNDTQYYQQPFSPPILNHRCVKCSWKAKKMRNNLSIDPLNFDTWLVARCDALPEDELHSAMRRAEALCAEVWRLKKNSILFKIEKNCFCKEKEIGRKTNQRIRAKETFYSPCKIVRIIISGEKTRRRCNINFIQ